MKVICNKHKTCKYRHECGGAKPHYFDPHECNKCPKDITARCYPIKEKEE